MAEHVDPRAVAERDIDEPELGRALSRTGLRDIADGYSSWDKAFGDVYNYLSDPR